MIARWVLIVLISSGLSYFAGYMRGYSNGVRNTRLAASSQAVTDLNSIIANHKQLIVEANAAGRALAKQTALREQHDNQTTKELRDALAKTATQRVHCVFSADVMRELTSARDRAAQAAATGLDEPVPGTGSGARE